jgi:hypothetical protein
LATLFNGKVSCWKYRKLSSGVQRLLAILLRGGGSCWQYWQLCSGVEGVAGNTGNSVHGSNLLFAGTPENIKYSIQIVPVFLVFYLN